MKKIFVVMSCLFSTVFASNTLDIYLDKIMLSKTLNLKESNATFTVPFELKRADIDISCEISDFKFSNFRKIGANTAKDILNNRLQALKDSYELAKVSNLSSSKDIADISQFLENNLNEQSQVNSQIELLNFTEDNEFFYVKDLNLRSKCENITIKYPLSSVLIYTKNSIITDLKSVEIKQNIIISGLKEDIENTNINFYPYNTSYGNAPGRFAPIYLQKEEKKVLDAPATMSLKATVETEAATPTTPVVSERTIHSFNFWNVENFSLKKNQENYISLNEQKVDANITNFIDGYATSKAYVMATFTPKFDIGEANTNLYINQNFITSSYQSKILKDQEVKMFFGPNNFIEVKKENINTKTDDNLLGTKETTKTLKRYTITNNSIDAQEITFVERVPVSTHADIVVTVLGDLTADNEGRVEKKFRLEPKESTSFDFGYAVLKPIVK